MAKLQLSTDAFKLQSKHEEKALPPLELSHLKTFIPNGLSRGSLVEIIGKKASGRTSVSLYILSESLSRGETCAYIDLSNQFDPVAVVQAGCTLRQLYWVRCQGNTEHAIRVADLLLHAGGFGVVLLDLCGADLKALHKIPLSYWFRFRRAVAHTPTILLICSESPQARSCCRHSLEVQARRLHWEGEAPFALFKALELTAIPRKATQAQVISIRPGALPNSSIWIPSGVA